MTTITPEAVDRVERMLRERMDAIERLLTAKLDAKDVALDLKAIDTERRLVGLNSEAERIQKVLDRSILRETFENYRDSERAAMDVARQDLQQWKDSVNTSQTAHATSVKVWVTAAGLLLAAITVALQFVTR